VAAARGRLGAGGRISRIRLIKAVVALCPNNQILQASQNGKTQIPGIFAIYAIAEKKRGQPDRLPP